MLHPINWVLVVVGAVLVLLEVLLGAISGFDLLLLGCAILLGGLIGVLAGTPIVGGSVALVLSLLYVFVGRRRIHRKRLVPRFPFHKR